jgi:hypothetical protein
MILNHIFIILSKTRLQNEDEICTLLLSPLIGDEKPDSSNPGKTLGTEWTGNMSRRGAEEKKNAGHHFPG